MEQLPLRETEQIGRDKSMHGPIHPKESQDYNDDDDFIQAVDIYFEETVRNVQMYNSNEKPL